MIDTLRTSRLLLRPLAPDDWPDVLAYASEPEVMLYLPEGVMTAEQGAAFIAEHCQRGALSPCPGPENR